MFTVTDDYDSSNPIERNFAMHRTAMDYALDLFGFYAQGASKDVTVKVWHNNQLMASMTYYRKAD